MIGVPNGKNMAESSSESTSNSLTTSTTTSAISAQTAKTTTATTSSPSLPHHAISKIPIEFVGEEEMALLEAALAATRSFFPSAVRSPPSSPFRSVSPRSLRSITLLSKRKLSGGLDIEDSYLLRFRRNRALSVTDLTRTEWCEKQMERVLCSGRQKVNKAMKVGQARHLELEEEVVKRITVKIESDEDKWALKLTSSITGVNQLLFEGLTRELPLLGFMEGEWIMGVIDEVRVSSAESSDGQVTLIETKTRSSETLPSEPQLRNGKFQLMSYKLLVDSLRTTQFPSRSFYSYFSLNPRGVLSQNVRDSIANLGFSAQTLEDIVRYYDNTFKMLPLTQNKLLLRYEYQKNQSLIAELGFNFDREWCVSKFGEILEFWRGEREAQYTPEEERWKCRYCQFASSCPANPDLNSSTPSPPPLEASSAS